MFSTRYGDYSSIGITQNYSAMSECYLLAILAQGQSRLNFGRPAQCSVMLARSSRSARHLVFPARRFAGSGTGPSFPGDNVTENVEAKPWKQIEASFLPFLLTLCSSELTLGWASFSWLDSYPSVLPLCFRARNL